MGNKSKQYSDQPHEEKDRWPPHRDWRVYLATLDESVKLDGTINKPGSRGTRSIVAGAAAQPSLKSIVAWTGGTTIANGRVKLRINQGTGYAVA